MKLLGRELAAHRLRCSWEAGLAFGRGPELPFAKTSVASWAAAAWKAARLRPIGLYEARHTCASTFITAGSNPKQIQVVMGHANIAMTFDRYGGPFPGGLEEAAAKADAYLARAAGQAAI